MPIFEEFIQFFFVASDDSRFKRVHEKQTKKAYKGDSQEYYRQFLESWRKTPKWYRYQHDILLLELVLRNGVNCRKIVADLEGPRNVQYKIRLKCKDYFVSTHKQDRYYQFKMWCKVQYNLFHRLKYITNILIKNVFERGGDISLYNVRIDNYLDIPTFSGKSRIFSDYHKKTHVDFITKEIKYFDPKLIKKASTTFTPRTRTNTLPEVLAQNFAAVYVAVVVRAITKEHRLDYENINIVNNADDVHAETHYLDHDKKHDEDDDNQLLIVSNVGTNKNKNKDKHKDKEDKHVPFNMRRTSTELRNTLN